MDVRGWRIFTFKLIQLPSSSHLWKAPCLNQCWIWARHSSSNLSDDWKLRKKMRKLAGIVLQPINLCNIFWANVVGITPVPSGFHVKEGLAGVRLACLCAAGDKYQTWMVLVLSDVKRHRIAEACLFNRSHQCQTAGVESCQNWNVTIAIFMKITHSWGHLQFSQQSVNENIWIFMVNIFPVVHTITFVNTGMLHKQVATCANERVTKLWNQKKQW